MNEAIQSPHLDETYRHVRNLVAHFVVVDPDSMTFRYPTTREGSSTVSFYGIQAKQLTENMNDLSQRLEVMRDVISELDWDDRNIQDDRKRFQKAQV